MKKIIVMAGSNSKSSINLKLAKYAFSLMSDSEALLVELSKTPLPLYSPDLEAAEGIPSDVTKIDQLIESADGIILSLAEYNGSYAAAFKNAFDWLSRVNMKVWKNKPMLLMATSPGKGGGSHVLKTASSDFSHFGGNIVDTFSLPTFSKNFTDETINEESFKSELLQKVRNFQDKI